jgi:hypothetical protein
MAFKMTEEEYMKMRDLKSKRFPKPPKPPESTRTPKTKKGPPKRKKRYNPFKDGRTPTGASYTTGP